MASGLKPLRRSQAVIGKVLRLNDQVCVGVETKSELAVQCECFRDADMVQDFGNTQ